MDTEYGVGQHGQGERDDCHSRAEPVLEGRERVLGERLNVA